MVIISDKHDKMDNERYVYVTTVRELVSRGHGFTESKNMVKNSPLLNKLKQLGHYQWMFFHNPDDDEKKWATQVENYYKMQA